MNYIASQPYIKIEREVTSVQQIDKEHNRMLYLYADRIVTKHREFLIVDVIDVSYRGSGKQNGLLYIHTNSGLFSYTVKGSPNSFIKACQKHIEVDKAIN